MTENTAVRPWELLAKAADLGAMRPALRARTEDLCRIQAELVDQMSALTQAWFARRREAAVAMQNAALALCDAADPLEAGRVYQQWLAGSLERLVADSLDAQTRLAGMAQLMLGAMPTLRAAPAEMVLAEPAERRAA